MEYRGSLILFILVSYVDLCNEIKLVMKYSSHQNTFYCMKAAQTISRTCSSQATRLTRFVTSIRIGLEEWSKQWKYANASASSGVGPL